MMTEGVTVWVLGCPEKPLGPDDVKQFEKLLDADKSLDLVVGHAVYKIQSPEGRHLWQLGSARSPVDSIQVHDFQERLVKAASGENRVVTYYPVALIELDSGPRKQEIILKADTTGDPEITDYPITHYQFTWIEEGSSPLVVHKSREYNNYKDAIEAFDKFKLTDEYRIGSLSLLRIGYGYGSLEP